MGELYTDFNAFPVIVTGQGENPDTKVLMYALKKWGLEKLCIEAPSYCTHLLQQGMLDEYFINYSMVFAGGQKSPGYASEFGHMKAISYLPVRKFVMVLQMRRICRDISTDTV